MSELQNIALFQRYHSNELSEVERAFFESRLLSDDSFKQQFDDYNESEKLIRLKELFSVKEELDKYDYSDGTDFWSTRALIVLIGLLGSLAILFYGLRYSRSDDFQHVSTTRVSETNAMNTSLERSTNTVQVKHMTERSGSTVPKDSVYFQEMPVVTSPDLMLIESVSEEEVVTPKIEEKTPCPLLVPEVKVLPSCDTKSSGLIRVERITGGEAPYSIRLHNGKASKGTPFTVEKLAANSYTLIITDHTGCTFEKNIEVPEMECKDQSEIAAPKKVDYVVTLPYEFWNIPDCPQRGTLEIIDQSGTQVYTGTLNASVSNVWSCENTNGAQVNPGVYFYKIVDLETKEERSGSITVLK